MSALPEAVARLLPLLRCVETHQPLRAADEAELARWNARLTAGGLPTRGDEVRTTPLEAALVRKDGRLAYPVDDGIPCLLLEHAIPLD